MATGDLVKLGTLYMGNISQKRPQRPWSSEYNVLGNYGDIPDYIKGQGIEIRDTSKTETLQIWWRELIKGDKKYLICDRNLLGRISWDDLNVQNLIKGKKIKIDGQDYLLRVLTGGKESRFSSGGRSNAGGKLPNEWDDWITNEFGVLEGFPKPTTEDLDSESTRTKFLGEHNQFWNWYYMQSWCQDVYESVSTSRTVRGSISPKYYDYFQSSGIHYLWGWRPVLELLNTTPTLNLTTLNHLTLHEKEQLPITGDVTDIDSGNVITVKYQINSTTVRNVKAYVSTGVKETFDKPLMFRGSNLYDGSILVASHLTEGINHTLKVWAEDDQGGKSEIATRTFKVITNRPPVLAITSTPTAHKLLDEDTITIEGTGVDPDGNTMTLTAQIHDATETIPIDNNGQWSFSFALNLLKDGDNLITFTLADQYQVTDTASVKVTRNAQRTYTQNVAMRLAVSSPEDIDTLIMWIKRGAADNKLRAMISIDKPDEEQQFTVMEKRETISNIAGSAVHEDEFFYTGTKEGQATIKMTNVDGMRIIMGATSNESKTT